MSIDDVTRLLEAANSIWAVTALAIIGLFVLAWKYGNELLKLSRDSNVKAREANAGVQRIEKDIVTNHGSENMGEAIDRLTGWTAKLLKAERKSAADRQQLNNRVAELSAGLSEVRELMLNHMMDDPEEESSSYSVQQTEEEDRPCLP